MNDGSKKGLGGWTRLWIGLSVVWISVLSFLFMVSDSIGFFELVAILGPPIALGGFFLFVEWVFKGFMD